MRPHMCLLVFMESNGSLWVLIDSYAFTLVFMGPYWSLSVLMSPISVLVGPSAFLWVLMCSYKSLCVFRLPYGS